jgi:hypothetical protein
MDKGQLQYLARHTRQGNLILFTGAGFSLSAFSLAGQQLPTVSRLKRDLWTIAFPSDEYDEASTLQDIYDVAMKRGGNATKALLKAHLTVDVNRAPPVYKAWFSMPWYRHYTVNIDDLDECASRAFRLSRSVRSVSAITESIGHYGTDLLSVHLNGRVSDLPNVTFSAREFGQRTARPDEWYSTLTADLLAHPVVYVGSQLDEPPLWQHIEIRRSKDPRTREMRPASFLVSPSLPKARAEMLKQYNITWIKMGQEDFASEVLSDLGPDMELGRTAIVGRFGNPAGSALRRVAQIRDEAKPSDLPSYLLGREPTWWDIAEGFAVERDFERGLATSVDESTARCVVITGTAGCGKSTTILRLALALDSTGASVALLEPNSGLPRNKIVREVVEAEPDWLVVDDEAAFGRALGQLTADVLSASPGTRMLVGARGTRVGLFLDATQLPPAEYLEVSVPHLVDSDIDGLVSALTAANRLGRLAGKSPGAQRKAFRVNAGRQLIVALIEATSGERFQEKLSRECEELDSDSAFLYAACAIATTAHFPMSKEELLLAHGTPDNSTVQRVEALRSRGMLVDSGGQLKVRHRLIAEEAVEHFSAAGQLVAALQGVIFAMATKVDYQVNRRSREWRLLAKLINHDFLKRVLKGDNGAIRSTFAEVEDLLTWDYHYWLQRGSFEVEADNMALAENFLEQARALEPHDAKVRTEWAYFSLKKAAGEPQRLESPGRVEEALRDLEDVIRIQGIRDSYPFHVYGSQGLRWVRRAQLTGTARTSMLERLLHVVENGRRLHPRDDNLNGLETKLRQEYLTSAVGAPDSSGSAESVPGA